MMKKIRGFGLILCACSVLAGCNKSSVDVKEKAGEEVSVGAVVKDESIWLTQKAMAELFEVQTPAISKHLKNIF